MEEETNREPEKNTEKIFHSRPFLLSLLCLFSFIFYGLLALLFLLALCYSGWITEVISHYVPQEEIRKRWIILVFSAGFLLHALAVTGAALMLKMKRAGYYLFGISSLIIVGYHLSQPDISILSTLVYCTLVILFGFFYNRLS